MSQLAKEFVVMPVHELKWVYHNGVGADNYNKDGKVYKAEMVFDIDSPNGKWIKDKCDSFWAENKPSGKSLKSMGYKLGRHKPTEEALAKDHEARGKLNGKISVTFSTKTTWPDGNPKVIRIFGAGDKKAGKAPPEISLGAKKIGNGTLGSMSGNMCIYINGGQAGVTFYLENIQVIKLVEYGNAESGFGSTEGGGYEGEDMADEASGFTPPPEEEAPSKRARPRI